VSFFFNFNGVIVLQYGSRTTGLKSRLAGPTVSDVDAAAIIHLDMDAFYASVEQRDFPDLRGKPVIVGGHPRRGVVLAASYEVRPFGVRSAMPMAVAVRKAPTAIVVPPRMSAYAEASDAVFAIMGTVTPLVEPLSLDEAFLDVTASRALFGPPGKIASDLRARIATEVDLPASAGIASVKFVAKIASDLAKPNGQKEVAPGTERTFLAPLPVARLWGVGPKTEAALAGLGLRTIGQISEADPDWLNRHVSGGRDLWELACGIDTRKVVPDREAKSLGAEDTFEEDLAGKEALLPYIHAQAMRVARRLRQAGRKTTVVQLKLKLADFTLLTRRTTLREPTDDGQALYRVASALLQAERLRQKVRLTGISAQSLLSHDRQLALFDSDRRTGRLNAALDRIHDKFGTTSLTTADLRESRIKDRE
jgi:DNA polymerase IV